MKTFSRTHRPESIEYNGQVYKPDHVATDQHRNGIKLGRGYHVLVKVLHKNLRGREDLHGKPYKPTEWIYSNELGLMRSNLPVKVETTTAKGGKIYEMRYPSCTVPEIK